MLLPDLLFSLDNNSIPSAYKDIVCQIIHMVSCLYSSCSYSSYSHSIDSNSRLCRSSSNNICIGHSRQIQLFKGLFSNQIISRDPNHFCETHLHQLYYTTNPQQSQQLLHYCKPRDFTIKKQYYITCRPHRVRLQSSKRQKNQLCRRKTFRVGPGRIEKDIGQE